MRGLFLVLTCLSFLWPGAMSAQTYIRSAKVKVTENDFPSLDVHFIPRRTSAIADDSTTLRASLWTKAGLPVQKLDFYNWEAPSPARYVQEASLYSLNWTRGKQSTLKFPLRMIWLPPGPHALEVRIAIVNSRSGAELERRTLPVQVQIPELRLVHVATEMVHVADKDYNGENWDDAGLLGGNTFPDLYWEIYLNQSLAYASIQQKNTLTYSRKKPDPDFPWIPVAAVDSLFWHMYDHDFWRKDDFFGEFPLHPHSMPLGMVQTLNDTREKIEASRIKVMVFPLPWGDIQKSELETVTADSEAPHARINFDYALEGVLMSEDCRIRLSYPDSFRVYREGSTPDPAPMLPPRYARAPGSPKDISALRTVDLDGPPFRIGPSGDTIPLQAELVFQPENYPAFLLDQVPFAVDARDWPRPAAQYALKVEPDIDEEGLRVLLAYEIPSIWDLGPYSWSVRPEFKLYHGGEILAAEPCPYTSDFETGFNQDTRRGLECRFVPLNALSADEPAPQITLQGQFIRTLPGPEWFIDGMAATTVPDLSDFTAQRIRLHSLKVRKRRRPSEPVQARWIVYRHGNPIYQSAWKELKKGKANWGEDAVGSFRHGENGTYQLQVQLRKDGEVWGKREWFLGRGGDELAEPGTSFTGKERGFKIRVERLR